MKLLKSKKPSIGSPAAPGNDRFGITAKEYNTIDILKFVLSLFVLVIHSEIDKTFISPLLRIAVPSFFLISSSLFFSKISTLPDAKSKNHALKRLVKRNTYLYLFWVILQIPIQLTAYHYPISFSLHGIWTAIKAVFLIIFYHGFTGSWYIVALVIGTVIIYFCSKKISAGWLVLLTLPIYVMCCFSTNYRGLFSSESFVMQFLNTFEAVTQRSPHVTLLCALPWIAIGNYFVTYPIRIKTSALGILLACFAALIAAERYWVLLHNWSYADDCYFTLILLCPALLFLLSQHQFSFHSRFRFREMSTLVYVTHGSCNRIIGYLLKKTSLDPLFCVYLKIGVSFAIIMIAGMLFLILRDKLHSKILRYAC